MGFGFKRKGRQILGQWSGPGRFWVSVDDMGLGHLGLAHKNKNKIIKSKNKYISENAYETNITQEDI